MVDLTSSKISNSLSGFNGNGVLSAFNLFDQNNYNQWYVQNIGTRYVLVSKFVYKVNSVTNMVSSSTTPASTINGMALSATTAAATGQKLCYASTIGGDVTWVLVSSRTVSNTSLLSGSSGSSSSSTG